MLLFAGLALYLFWVKALVAALALVVVNVLLIERTLHTQYVFRDGMLHIERGRFAKTITVAVSDIYACRPMTNTFGLAHYLLLQYGHDRIVMVQPTDETSFVAYLKRLQTVGKEEDED